MNDWSAGLHYSTFEQLGLGWKDNYDQQNQRR